MGYPASKQHRISRRKLGKGQTPTSLGVAVTLAGAASTAVLTFSRPVVVRGPIGLTVATLTYVSQAVNSPTQVTITMSGAVATHAYTLNSGDPNIATPQGGQNYGASGTF